MLDSLENSYIHEKQFSSDVSHKLRTPISVILAESDYALEYCENIIEARESISDYSNSMREQGISLVCNIEDKIYIKGQSTMISRMIDNLVRNAVKFTKDEICIGLYVNSSYVVFEVKDNGIGISKEDLSRIWDRFYQTDGSRNKEKNERYGLGLHMVYKIAKSHAAKPEVESEPGNGSVFRIMFEKI